MKVISIPDGSFKAELLSVPANVPDIGKAVILNIYCNSEYISEGVQYEGNILCLVKHHAIFKFKFVFKNGIMLTICTMLCKYMVCVFSFML
jgi:hypothetical protein